VRLINMRSEGGQREPGGLAGNVVTPGTHLLKVLQKNSSGAMKAIGLVETNGLFGLAAATDATVKAANVQVVNRTENGGGVVMAIVSGGAGSHILANPAEGVVEAFLSQPLGERGM